jgi:hypothetical protein
MVCMAEVAGGLGNRAANQRSTKNPPGCRCCCAPSDSRPSEKGKERPDAPCSKPGGTCLCHGAVMDRPTAPPMPNAGIVSLLPPEGMLPAGEWFFAADGLLPGQAACHFPAAESGREVRALVASFLL